MEVPKELTATIRRISGNRATIDLNGQSIVWPAEALPGGAQEGDTVALRMLTAQAAEQDRQELARTILSEILGGSR